MSSITSGIVLTWTAPVFPKLNSTDPNKNPFGRSVTILEQSWIGSSLCVGALVGPIIGGCLSARIGRRNAMIVTVAVLYFPAFLILAFARITYLYYFARFLCGLGYSSLLTVIPVYLGEIAETENRGAVISTMNFSVCVGELFDFILGPFVSIMTYSLTCAIIPGVFTFIFPFFPESPYFLIAKDRLEKAEKSIMRLRSQAKEEVQEEFVFIRKVIDEENAQLGTLMNICKSKSLRKGLIICSALVTIQQLSGIAPIQFYITSIFEASGSSLHPDASSIAVGAVQLISSFLPLITVDRFGRRPLLLMSAFGMFSSELFLGLFFFLKDQKNNVDCFYWLPVASLMLYIVMFNVGFGPLPWTVVGEVFPISVKSIASTIIVILCWTVGFLISNIFPTVANIIGVGGMFCIFSVSCLLGFIFVWTFVIETKGKSFLEIQEILNK